MELGEKTRVSDIQRSDERPGLESAVKPLNRRVHQFEAPHTWASSSSASRVRSTVLDEAEIRRDASLLAVMAKTFSTHSFLVGIPEVSNRQDTDVQIS